MSEEIELKFIVHPDSVESLLTQLAEWESDYSQYEHMRAQRLSNVYYETADNYLRRNGIGLRIRGENERYEMTAKTAGKVIGGLHQHPEYNVALEKAELISAYFPRKCGRKIAILRCCNPHLIHCLVRILREKWVFTYYQSVIEVALDRGEIRAGDLSEPLCELEMELKLGQTTHLLALAKKSRNLVVCGRGASVKRHVDTIWLKAIPYANVFRSIHWSWMQNQHRSGHPRGVRIGAGSLAIPRRALGKRGFLCS